MSSDVMCALRSAHMQASWPPYVYMVHQELLIDVPFVQAKRYLSKITASHFSTLNMKFANWNVLKRILIAMHNKNKADCNENFRICAEEPIALLYNHDRIPSTTPGAEPPRGAKDSGSARSHSTHLETSSQKRP